MKNPLNILLIQDHNPGHYHQSDGIVDALETQFDTTVTRYIIPKRIQLLDNIARYCLQMGLAPLAQACLRFNIPTSKEPFNLVVSAGGATLAHNITATKILDCKNFFSGSIRKFDPEAFSLILHIDQMRSNWPRHRITLKPSPASGITPKTVASPPKKILILLGGPIEGCAVVAASLDRLFKKLAASDIDLTIITSRRTPTGWLQLASRAARHNARISMVDYNQKGKTMSLADRIADSDAVFVTEDSTSMISEAVALQRPVISITQDEGNSTSDSNYLKMLENNQWIVRLTESQIDGISTDTFDDCVPMACPAKEQLAEILIEALEL